MVAKFVHAVPTTARNSKSKEPASSAAFQVKGRESRQQLWTRIGRKTARTKTDCSTRSRVSSRSGPVFFFLGLPPGIPLSEGRIKNIEHGAVHGPRRIPSRSVLFSVQSVPKA